MKIKRHWIYLININFTWKIVVTSYPPIWSLLSLIHNVQCVPLYYETLCGSTSEVVPSWLHHSSCQEDQFHCTVFQYISLGGSDLWTLKCKTSTFTTAFKFCYHELQNYHSASNNIKMFLTDFRRLLWDIYWRLESCIFFNVSFILMGKITYILFCGWGLRITSNRGRIWIKTRLTQGAIVWVWGDRKWIFKTTTVTQILEKQTKIIS